MGMIIIQLVIGAYSRTLANKAIPYNEYNVLRNLVLPLASTIGELCSLETSYYH